MRESAKERTRELTSWYCWHLEKGGKSYDHEIEGMIRQQILNKQRNKSINELGNFWILDISPSTLDQNLHWKEHTYVSYFFLKKKFNFFLFSFNTNNDNYGEN